MNNKKPNNDLIKTINPATGKIIKTYTIMSDSTINEIINNTHNAFNLWKKSSFLQRSEKLIKLADMLRQNKKKYAMIITEEMGKPITQSLAEIDKCVWVCEYYAKNSKKYLQDRIIKTEKHKTKVCYQPLGIVFAIMPWNFPFWQVFRFLCPNLMAGNAGLLSHAPISTGAALAIEELVFQAGFPKNLFRSLIIDNKGSEKVIANKKVIGVTLTGSEAAGKSVASIAGKHLKKVVLELGGADPYLILEDADLEKAANSCVSSRLNNTGQVCIAAKRIIIVKSIYKEFEKLIFKKIKTYKMGDPKNKNTNFGPIAREDLRSHLHSQISKSIKQGANLITGGKIPNKEGFYYPPTLLTNVKENMVAFKEELFGPVIALIKAKDEEEAISLANNSNYGLGASIFTSDLIRGEQIATELIDSGSVTVNNFVSSDPRVPFGGIKSSGFGRELSEEGIKEFINIKSISIDN